MHAPTGAARWFNRLDQDFSTSASSRVQTLDYSTTEDTSLYSYWIRNTTPKHPVLKDPQMKLLTQIHGTMEWPEVTVVDCQGKVAYSKKGVEMNETIYREVKAAIEKTLEEPHCNPD